MVGPAQWPGGGRNVSDLAYWWWRNAAVTWCWGVVLPVVAQLGAHPNVPLTDGGAVVMMLPMIVPTALTVLAAAWWYDCGYAQWRRRYWIVPVASVAALSGLWAAPDRSLGLLLALPGAALAWVLLSAGAGILPLVL